MVTDFKSLANQKRQNWRQKERGKQSNIIMLVHQKKSDLYFVVRGPEGLQNKNWAGYTERAENEEGYKDILEGLAYWLK